MADANNDGNNNNNAQTTPNGQNNNNTPQNTNVGANNGGNSNNNVSIDYNELAGVLDKRQDGLLKSLLKQQGIGDNELSQAITMFKENQSQKANEEKTRIANIETENQTLKAQMQQMKLVEVANQEALELGIDVSKIPYVLKLADFTTAVNDKGEIVKDTVKTVLNKVLEDLPEFKSSNSKNNGFQKVGADNNGDGKADVEEQLRSIFGIKDKNKN